MTSNEKLALELLKIMAQQGKLPLDAVIYDPSRTQRQVETNPRGRVTSPDIKTNAEALMQAFQQVLEVVKTYRRS